MSVPQGRDRRLVLSVIIAAIIAILIGFLGAYLVVVSQNPSPVSGNFTDYGVIQ